MNKNNAFSSLLLLLFIALKLMGFIDWSWWWVMSPLWITVIIVVVIIVIYGYLERKQ